MPTDINTILRMNKPGGRDVGRALMMSVAHSAAGEGAPLFDQAAFDKLLSRIDSEHEFQNYRCYASIVTGLLAAVESAQAHLQQAYNAFFSITTIQREILNHEAVRVEWGRCKETVGNAVDAPLDRILSRFESLDSIYGSRRRHELSASVRSRIYPSLREIAAFDFVCGVLAVKCEVAELGGFAPDTSSLEAISRSYNALRLDVFRVIGENYFGLPERNNLIYMGEALFPEIALAPIMRIPHAARDAADEYFSGIRDCSASYEQLVSFIRGIALMMEGEQDEQY